jgi:CheY-like chemotaxis protein
MRQAALIHFNPNEAQQYIGLLEQALHKVGVYDPGGGMPALRALRDNPPDVFVIDLTRQPSHGREIAVWLRQQKATRHVPMVFVGGEPDKIARVKKVLPDAIYTEWSKIRSAIKQAIKHAPKEPHVPGTFDSYAGVALPKKLGIRAGITLALLGAPKGFESTLGKLPTDVHVVRSAGAHADLILLFVKSIADLKRRFPAAKRALAPKGAMWIAWPKKSSGVQSDLTQQIVREYGLSHGLVDYKICSIDPTWSGLRFAHRDPAKRSRRT